MTKAIFLTLSLLVSSILMAQVPSDYFQQEVNYDIDVSLNDEQHELSGSTNIEYINNSPDELKEIYLHLWPNAYRNRRTALAKQMIENGNDVLYFSKQPALGGYRELDIKINGKVVEWDYWEENLDIAKIVLTKSLASGESLEINTTFLMKIPNSISRLGHVGQSYQLTQWYPKPAVYDKRGWHPMPYLDQGEFYSEFGNFDVEITLAENYVVGATGVLQNEKEIEFLENKILGTQSLIKENNFPNIDLDTMPASSEEMKTIKYLAENVHDFAWFADKRFFVNKSEVTLESGTKVDTYVMFTNEQANYWAKAIEYVNRSVEFYSKEVGEYPYPQATAVQSALSAGAGMEYPMITVIGAESSAKSLDEVITHEVGHNWFYGILASNERDYAWMDEGFNSYYEQEYMAKYYEKKKDAASKIIGVSDKEVDQLNFYIPMRRRTDQPINTPSQELTLSNYWITAYDKPAYLLTYLREYLGQDEFDQLMRTYYETWKFKHPYPEDVKALFEKETGKDLSWLFDGLINTVKPLDYRTKSIEKNETSYDLTIENIGEISAPFPIDIKKGDEIINTIWVEGFEGEKTINIPTEEADKFVIDDKKIMPDFHRENNTITAKGSKIEPFRFKFLGGVGSPDRTTLYWTPIMAYNKYDGFMAGLALYNTTVPSQKLEWSVAPMFGFRSKDITGLGHLKYHLYPEKLQRISFGVGYKGFNYFENDFYTQFGESKNLGYHRINPNVEIELKNKKARSKIKQTIAFDGIIIGQEDVGDITPIDTISLYSGHETEWRVIPRLSYEFRNDSKLYPYSLKASLDGESYKRSGVKEGYLRLYLEGKVEVNYNSHSSVHLRLFGGGFLMNSKKDILNSARGAFSLSGNSIGDVTFDDFYFGRGEGTGVLSQQVNNSVGGGFKLPLSETSSSIGTSNIGIIATNIYIDPPFKMPNFLSLRLYLDFGYAFGKDEGEFLYSSGLSLGLFKNRVEVFLPFVFKKSGIPGETESLNLAGSGNLRTFYKQKGNYLSRITFKINLNRMNPFKEAYNIQL